MSTRSWFGRLLRRWADRIDPAPKGAWYLNGAGGVSRLPSYARGGVIRGPSGPSDDRVTYKLSDGHGWVRPMTVEVFGEEGLKRLLGVDHIHPLVACPHCGTAPAALVNETDDARLFGCHACNETWALPSGERS